MYSLFIECWPVLLMIMKFGCIPLLLLLASANKSKAQSNGIRLTTVNATNSGNFNMVTNGRIVGNLQDSTQMDWIYPNVKFTKLTSTVDDGDPNTGYGMAWINSGGFLKRSALSAAFLVGVLGSSYANSTDINNLSNRIINDSSNLKNNYALTSYISTVGHTGAYSDLTGKPTIPSAQVNSDWNSSSGLSQILNKPAIPTDNNQLTNGAGYITSYTETDPIWTGVASTYRTKTQNDALYQPIGNYLTTETDPTVPSYSKGLTAFSIIKTSTDSLYYPLSNNPSSYLTANQSISFTPTGDVTGSSTGATSLTPTFTIGANKVTNTMLAGSIAYSKLSLTNSIVNDDIVSLAYSKLTATPTTLAGYGVTDGLTSGIAASIYEPIITPSNTTKRYWNGYKSFVALNTDSMGVEGSTNLWWTVARFNTAFSAKTTDNLTEGSTNLYFTNSRSRGAISLTTTGSAGAATYNSSTGALNIPSYSLTNTDAKADNSTKGVATFDSSYFDDNNSGLISFKLNNGTGTVSSNAVTINSPKGTITVSSPNILASANLSITLTNSYITTNSNISVQIGSNNTSLTLPLFAYVKSKSNGSCVINLLNVSLLSIFNTAIVLDFVIIN